jgi:hypothetical protein
MSGGHVTNTELTARRLFEWYRDEVCPAPEFLPKDFDHLNDLSQESYRRDAAICEGAKDPEVAAQRMYNAFPHTIPWDKLPAKDNPRAYYVARARAAMQVPA